VKQCCGSGIFYSRSGAEHFSIPDQDPNIFHPGSFIKRGIKDKNQLAFYGFMSKRSKKYN
jgi:hypothetical protein